MSDDGTTFGNSLSIEIADRGIDALSISPSGRDVALASRKGLLIVDLDNPYEPPRSLPYLTAWNVADVQWNVHRHRTNWICSTSNQKLFIWNLDLPSRRAVEFVLLGHTRAITDINWSAHQPEILASCSVDAFVHCWDMRDPRRPVNTFSDWQAGATQVKWNRQNEHVIASSHGRFLRIWDDRKGASPLTSIEVAHHSTKVYGIDFNRTRETGIISCALDKSVKFWDFSKSLTEPEQTIRTTTPIWRARHTPMGGGLMTLPQRGDNNLYLWDRRGTGDNRRPACHVFSGHTDQVKEFLWRARGGQDPSVDDREFQLVTWSKDQTLRLWPVDLDVLGRIGHDPRKPVRVRQTRRGAPYVTYRRELPIRSDISPSDAAATAITHTTVPPGQSRPGYSAVQWMRGVRMTRRAGRPDLSSSAGLEATVLGEEFPQIEAKFPKIRFEEASVKHRTCTVSLQGPWGEKADDLTFLRLKVVFPSGYPTFTPPKFDLERTKALGGEKRAKLLRELSTIAVRYRERGRPCLEAFVRHLLGEDVLQERFDDELASSDSEEDDDPDATGLDSLLLDDAQQNVPLPRSSAAIWCGDRLVCFFVRRAVEPAPATKAPAATVESVRRRRAQRHFASFGYLARHEDDENESEGELDEFDVQDVIAAKQTSGAKAGTASLHERASTVRQAPSHVSDVLSKDVVVVKDFSDSVHLRPSLARQCAVAPGAAGCVANAELCRADGQVGLAEVWEMTALMLDDRRCTDESGALFEKPLGLAGDLLQHFRAQADLQTFATLSCTFVPSSFISPPTSRPGTGVTPARSTDGHDDEARPLVRADSQLSVISASGAISLWLTRRPSKTAIPQLQPTLSSTKLNRSHTSGSLSAIAQGSVSHSTSHDSRAGRWQDIVPPAVYTQTKPELLVEVVPLEPEDPVLHADLLLEAAEADARGAYAGYLHRLEERIKAAEVASCNATRQRQLRSRHVTRHLSGDVSPGTDEHVELGRTLSHAQRNSSTSTATVRASSVQQDDGKFHNRRATTGAASISRERVKDMLKAVSPSSTTGTGTPPTQGAAMPSSATSRLREFSTTSSASNGTVTAVENPRRRLSSVAVADRARPFFTSPFMDDLARAARDRWVCARCADCADATAACASCRARRTSVLCTVCERVVRGRYTYCPCCEHGGHLGCVRNWRAAARHHGGSASSCPTGCGCQCGLNEQVASVGDPELDDVHMRARNRRQSGQSEHFIASSPTERTAVAPRMRDLWRSAR